MSETLRHSATIDFEHGIATSCERERCYNDDVLHAWIASGDFGRDSIVVYCHDCSENVAKVQTNYTYVGEVADYGGEDDD